MILRKVDRFSEVVRSWEGETVAILGGGPSLTLEQVGMVKGRRCIAVNNSYLLAPWADVCYFADSHFWKWHTEGVPVEGLNLTAEEVRWLFAAFPGQKCSIENSGGNITDPAVHILRNRDHPGHGNGLSLDPKALATGTHSGFQALNLAILAGAGTVILLGFDGGPVDGRTHYHGGHPRPTPPEVWPHQIEAHRAAKKAVEKIGVRVWNCSPGSRIDAWPRADLNEVL